MIPNNSRDFLILPAVKQVVDEIEITKLDEEAKDNLVTWISVVWEIFNELKENGSNGEGLASEDTNPDSKD
ncbi:MAG: hypothetical protein Q8R55_03775 [Candidatus Taylorbacteria bacterium]|nr:hypothetical protein [Candidatus Taylorbacteria bacterium]